MLDEEAPSEALKHSFEETLNPETRRYVEAKTCKK